MKPLSSWPNVRTQPSSILCKSSVSFFSWKYHLSEPSITEPRALTYKHQKHVPA